MLKLVGAKMTRPVMYTITSKLTGQQWLAAVEAWPWAMGAGLGKVESDFFLPLESMSDITGLRCMGYRVETLLTKDDYRESYKRTAYKRGQRV